MANGVTTDQGLPAPTGNPTAEASAQQILDQYASFIDWDPRFEKDSVKWLKALVQHGLAGDPTQAIEWLWNNATPADTKKVYPGAEFAMTPDAYRITAAQLGQSFYETIGTDIPHDVMRYAIQNQLTPSQLQTYIFDQVLRDQTGKDAAPSWLDLKNSPWLASGVTYQSAAQTFAQQEPLVPADSSSVRNWWNFISTSRSLSSGREAQQSVAPPGGGGRQQQGADTETR